MGIKPSQVIDDLLEITNADLGRDVTLVHLLQLKIKADLDSSNFTFSADTLRLLNEAKEFVPDEDDEDEDWEDDFPDEEDDLED